MGSLDAIARTLWMLVLTFSFVGVGTYWLSGKLPSLHLANRTLRISAAMGIAFSCIVPAFLAMRHALQDHADYLRNQVCATIPPLQVNVRQPIIAPIPRMVLTRDITVRRAIVEALTNVEPKWPYVDPNSDELDPSGITVVVMSDAPAPAPEAEAEPQALSVVHLGRETSIDEIGTLALFTRLVDQYELIDQDGKKALATRRVPVGASFFGYTSYCARVLEPTPAAIDAIVRMIRATLRPRRQAALKSPRPRATAIN